MARPRTEPQAPGVEDAGRCLVTKLPGVLLVSVCSFLSYRWQSLERYSTLCRSFRDCLNEDAVWQHLCNDFWFVTEERFEEWPSLRSYRALYRVLEQWAALEGFYTLPAAFPWCLLVLLRFEAGALVAEAIRFSNTESSGSGIVESRVRMFEITFQDAETGHHNIRTSARFPLDSTGQLSGGATILPLPDRVGGLLPQSLSFTHRKEVIPRWITRTHGLCVSVAAEALAGERGRVSDGDGTDADAESDDEPPLPRQGLDAWWPAAMERTQASVEDHTSLMVRQLLEVSQSLPLALVRSPAECALQDEAAPRLRPGLYVGDYNHAMYGQFRHEVLLVEYRECQPEGIEALFARPFEGSGLPEMMQQVLQEAGDLGHESVGFLVGTKITGDAHVPAGQTTFVALCSPPTLRRHMEQLRAGTLDRVINRSNRQHEDVLRSWPGFGTLAMPGFRNPSWETGSLVQLHGVQGGCDRFGFVWSRNQDAIVLEYVQAQLQCPFLSRKWLPEALR